MRQPRRASSARTGLQELGEQPAQGLVSTLAEHLGDPRLVPSPYRVRGDVRVTAVLDETDDALVVDGPRSIWMEKFSRCVRRLLV